MEDLFGIIFVMTLLFGIITGIATGINYIEQQNTVAKVCIEIDWHSPTCERLKAEKLK